MATTTRVTSTSNAGTTQLKSTKKALQTQDFMNLMLTQLQNQDPMNPTSNSELMAQMSQIGQLQANSELQDMLRGMAAQNQLGSAGSMLGKIVRGTDDQNNPVEGLVTSLRVEDNKVYLELDNGNTLSLDRVTYVAPGISANTSAAGTPVAS